MARPGSLLMIGAFGILPSKRKMLLAVDRNRRQPLGAVEQTFSLRFPPYVIMLFCVNFVDDVSLTYDRWKDIWWLFKDIFCQFSIKHMLLILTLVSPIDDSNEYPQHVFHGETLNYHHIPALSVSLLRQNCAFDLCFWSHSHHGRPYLLQHYDEYFLYHSKVET